MKLPLWKEVADRCRLTLSYWSETEVHVYALAVAASVMLSFFPFLIVIVSLCRYVLKWRAAAGAIYAALGAYFPGEMGEFIVRNLSVTVADRGALQLVPLLLLLFTANGISAGGGAQPRLGREGEPQLLEKPGGRHGSDFRLRHAGAGLEHLHPA